MHTKLILLYYYT
jgi:hypothetical protein